ncbi:RNA pseudouridine synthase [Candidatus Omnitrophus magneticus]|uniref:Pseudouridine synthase n=1 Tax=Candidatus Omnitrophus magneticus TaxID=1609969 RepID=A0A0F0CTU5_9BACT|nr:RNA pseudouridine synthase [Candidatus Omnitrophus magneticus]
MEKRLQVILAEAGIASRRGSIAFIEEGRVSVDGKVVTEKGYKVDPFIHAVLVDGKPLQAPIKKKYFIFNKPKNVISTSLDTHERAKITDFFKNIDGRLYSIGRLDKDTTGVIIITNDGDLTHRLSHPSFEIEKEYIAKVKGNIPERNIHILRSGIELDGKKLSRCVITKIGREKNGDIFNVKIHEGRKRQIRRMFEEIGSDVISLERIKYAGLTSDGLKQGEFRELTKSEEVHLKKIAGSLTGRR